MAFIRAAAILAIGNKFRTPSLELKCLGTSFVAKDKSFESLGTQHGRRVIKTHYVIAAMLVNENKRSLISLVSYAGSSQL